MAKSKKKKNKRLVPARQSVKKSTPVFGNIVISVILGVILLSLYQIVPAYRWVVDSLVVNNLKIVWENSNLSVEQKYAIKLGFDAQYINYIRENTPEDAVILMPTADEFLKGDFNSKGTWGVKSITWSTYFLYPRTLVKEKYCDDYPELCQKISHVMIVNYWGYDKVDYAVKKKIKHGLLPVHFDEQDTK